MIGISACLGGVMCRYDGQHQAVAQLVELVQTGQAVMVCPEVLGGLPIPREPAEIVGGDGRDVWSQKAKVITVTGEDVSEQFMNGAKLAYQKLHDLGITQLILKEKVLLAAVGLFTTAIFQESKKKVLVSPVLIFNNKE